jgi:aspartate carbamoyltransferase catalytic subunit
MPAARAAAVSTRWDRRHLLSMEDLAAAEILELCDAAEHYLPQARGDLSIPRLTTLVDRFVAMLFLEDSTRTRSSFTIAARRLGADSLNLSGEGSSLSKGETLADTALNIQAMGVHAIVVRSQAAGAAQLIARAVQCPVINAGDGRHEHPTQALLDVMTMRQRLGDLRGRVIAIVGDINGSRVARSNIHALVALGADVRLVGPPTLVPSTFLHIASGPGRISISHAFDEVLGQADAVMMLRVQFERGTDIAADYRQQFALTAARAQTMKPGAIVMHPGPMNRGLELDGDVADDSQRSVIMQQVTNGVAMRMAVLAALLADR